MLNDTFIFLDEFSDTELYIFLNKSKEKIYMERRKDWNNRKIPRKTRKLLQYRITIRSSFWFAWDRLWCSFLQGS